MMNKKIVVWKNELSILEALCSSIHQPNVFTFDNCIELKSVFEMNIILFQGMLNFQFDEVYDVLNSLSLIPTRPHKRYDVFEVFELYNVFDQSEYREKIIPVIAFHTKNFATSVYEIATVLQKICEDRILIDFKYKFCDDNIKSYTCFTEEELKEMLRQLYGEFKENMLEIVSYEYSGERL
jgi:hypothetical protein